MIPLRPYRVSVFNCASQRTIGSYISNEVPRVGELILWHGDDVPPDDPFYHAVWRVADVVWIVAARGSRSAMDTAREAETHDGQGFCTWVEVHVWPTEGPHFAITPKWIRDEDEAEQTDGGET